MKPRGLGCASGAATGVTGALIMEADTADWASKALSTSRSGGAGQQNTLELCGFLSLGGGIGRLLKTLKSETQRLDLANGAGEFTSAHAAELDA
jgi:hypothetical protein